MTYRCSRWKSNLVVRFNDDTGISVHFFPTKQITQTFMLPSCWRFYKHAFLQQKLKFDKDPTKNMIVLVLTTWMDRRSMHLTFYCTTILGVCEHKEPMNMHEYATTSNSTIVLFWWSFHSVYLIFPGMFQYTNPCSKGIHSRKPIAFPDHLLPQKIVSSKWHHLQVGFSWERCFDASVEGLANHHYMGNLPPALNRMVPLVQMGRETPSKIIAGSKYFYF